MTYISNETLQNLPYGPLTKDVYDSLSRSDLDASRTVAHRVAVERGVEFGAAMRESFAAKLAARGIFLDRMATSPTAEDETL